MARQIKESNFGTPSQALLNVSNRAVTNTVSQPQNKGGLEGVLGNIKNWLTDTAGAVGNTLKDTYTAVAGGLMQPGQNLFREYLTGKEKELKDNVAKKYGFNSFNDISDEGFQNQDLVKELNAVSNTVKKARSQSSDIFNNNAITKNMMNTKQGDYGSNAIKTWNLGADILTAPFQGPGQVALNAGQGYLSAIGDELKGKDVVWDPVGDAQGNSSATESFEWGKVGKEGTAQAAGNVAGGLAGMGIGDLGGKLLGKSGKISNLAGKALNSGLARGATGGAAAGATTAGVETALNGGTLQDVLANAAAGGAQGAQMGGAMGLGMGIANRGIQMAKNKLNGGTTGTVEPTPMEETTNTDEINQLEKATGWNGEEIDLSKRNKLQKAGKAFKQTAENIENSDVYNKLYSKTAEKIQRNDSINRLKKLGFSPEDYDRAANYSETTNKFIKEAIPDNPLKNTSIVDDLTDVDGMTTGVINSDKLAQKVKNETLRSINNARTDNPNTIDEYSIRKLWDESERIGKLENEYRTKSMNVNGGDASSDYATAAEYLGNVRKQLRNMVDNEVDWGDTFDKDILANRLKNAGADQANIDNITNAKNLAELKRNTALYEDARQMHKEMQTSRTRRNAVSGTSSTNPINIAAQESGINEVIKTAVRPVRNVTSKITNVVGNTLDTAGNIANKASNIVSNSTNYDAINPDVLNGVLRATNRDITNDVVNNNTLEGQLAGSNTTPALQATTSALNGDYYAGLPTTGTSGTGTLGTTTTTGTGNTMQSTGNNFLDRLSVAMELAMEAGDLKAVTQMMDIYSQASKLFGDQSSTNNTSDLNATQQQNLVKLKTAGSALDQLEELFDKAGGGQGPLVGNISNFFGSIGMNSDNSTYNQLAEGLINQIAAAVGKTDSLNTEGEVERAMSLIPKITDDATTAKNKLAQLRAMLQTTTNNYNEVLGLTQ